MGLVVGFFAVTLVLLSFRASAGFSLGTSLGFSFPLSWGDSVFPKRDFSLSFSFPNIFL